MKQAKWIGLILMIIPVAVFALVKPAKIIFPELAGASCAERWLCVEQPSTQIDAESLYNQAIRNVEEKLTPFEDPPKMIFCSSNECFSRFGLDKQAAASIAGFGIVIAPTGWQRHYIEHELIHQWQADNFGALSSWQAPEWISEGMAYALSDDPREELSEPFQSYRQRYQQTYGKSSGQALKSLLADEL